ncbi:NERD domain-containing protein [Bacillus sp. FJAT-49711]|uniref:nuclease-related domain-containing protein n=1 Tax=Bacillus sp. FJAT-49711 TaxID=2833585 RepID=UPI001BCA51CC|nr:nuclease-related domain-containing protein [Bacillus sp. FJAT-49711]MBS4219362.1 NERD domain-containing protein [Bacillus sp. FJAT-49711]
MKPRVESLPLKVSRILNRRKVLSAEEAARLMRDEKGYEGELLFDDRVEKLSKEWLVLNDLQLESNNTNFQIDSFLITQKPMLFEIKNHEGDYYIEGDKWYYINGDVVPNPVNQLERTESLLQRLLQDHGFNIPIEAYIIFVNPNFHLYNAPRNLPIKYPAQLNRFFNKLDKNPIKVNEYHMRLAKKLIYLHKNVSPRTILPKYSYNDLRKGITCTHCHSFNLESKKMALFCKNCGTIENISSAILRSVDEYTLLFPERKITISNILDWCNGIRTRNTIRNILLKQYTLKYNGKASYYEKTSK